MNMLDLLNPVRESLDWDGGRHRDQPHAAATGGAEAAAMSLMLLGQDEKPSSAEKTTAAVTPLPMATLCFSNLNITATASADDAHAFTEGLCTPLPATADPCNQPSGTPSAAVTFATPSFSAATPSGPHLSPVADKLQHIGSWSSHDAATSSHQQLQQSPNFQQQYVQSKRPRHERSTPRPPSKIEHLSFESQAQQSQPVAQDAASCTDEAIASDTRMDEHDKRQIEDPCARAASPTGHCCAVTGCLRVVQHMEKCAVHKGMKLCCASGCFRPVQSRGFCKSHGGGARCKHPGCKKGAISKGRCRTHGGGTRCAIPSCSKWAQRFGCCVRHSKAFTASAAATAAAGQMV